MEDIIKVEGVAKAYGKHQVHKGLDLGIKKRRVLYSAWSFRLRQNGFDTPYCRA